METMARVLLELAGARPASAATQPAALAGWDHDYWLTIRAAAGDEGLGPPIAAHLRAAGLLDGLPPAVQEIWRGEWRRTLVAAAGQTRLLAQVGAELDRIEVPFRVLKGLALAHSVYPDPAARNVGDLDLWVLPPDTSAAMAALSACGLVMPHRDSRPAAFLHVFGKEAGFAPPGDPPPFALVDLHWHPTAPWWMRRVLPIPEADLFLAAAPVVIGGQTYQTLAPTETFYYLCLHTALGHRFEGLRWLLDLAAVLDAGAVDWAHLHRLAAESGTRVMIWRALELLDYWLGRDTRRQWRGQPAALHQRWVRRALPGPPAARSLAADAEWELRVPWEQLVLLPGPGAVGRALAQLLWPPPRWLRLRYSLPPGAPVWRARARHLGRLRRLWRRGRR